MLVNLFINLVVSINSSISGNITINLVDLMIHSTLGAANMKIFFVRNDDMLNKCFRCN